ncbi:hypothetical protein DID88_002074 [Monilinia fructigena]|uniref:Uncharacterized protein n=1 Tax=Monilinia fructigena TaxID=38457 RepID=A0A395IVK4_9HELO|nr:hypothetical protein DID88_002074 [Monilinia fructigena]
MKYETDFPPLSAPQASNNILQQVPRQNIPSPEPSRWMLNKLLRDIQLPPPGTQIPDSELSDGDDTQLTPPDTQSPDSESCNGDHVHFSSYHRTLQYPKILAFKHQGLH